MTSLLRSFLVAALCVLILGGRAASDEKPAKEAPPPPSVEQVAQLLVEALDAGEDRAFDELARARVPDPWMLVDELSALGKVTAAQRVAAVQRGPDGPALARFAAGWSAFPDAAKRRTRLAEVLASVRARSPKRVVARSTLQLSDAGDVTAIRLLLARGSAYRALRNSDAAVEAFREAATRADQLGWLQGTVEAAFQASALAVDTGKHALGVAALKRVLAIEALRLEAGPDPTYRRNQAAARTDLGATYAAMGRLEEALTQLEAGRKLSETAGLPVIRAVATEHMGRVLQLRGKLDAARARYEEAFDLFVAQGKKGRAAAVLGNLANIDRVLGKHEAAETTLRRGLVLAAEARNAILVAHFQRGLGTSLLLRGETRQALQHHLQAAAVAEALKDGRLAALCYRNVQIALATLGRHAEALRAIEKSLAWAERIEAKAPQAAAHVQIGTLHQILGDSERSIAAFQAGLRLAREAGHAEWELNALTGLGLAHTNRGEIAKGLAYHEQVRKRAGALGQFQAVARAEVNIGDGHLLAGRPRESLGFLNAALQKRTLLANGGALPTLLRSLARAHLELDQPERALRFAHEAFQLSEAASRQGELLYSLRTLARVHLGLSNFSAARSFARRAAKLLAETTAQLRAESSTRTREAWTHIYTAGLTASRMLGDLESTWFFLESSRATALQQGIRNADALRAVVLPPHLRKEEDLARLAEREALARVVAVQKRRNAKVIRAARQILASARTRRDAIVAKIQREARVAAALLHPQPATLAEVQAALEPGEALVLYGLLDSRGSALVLTQKTRNVVELLETAEILALVAAARSPASPYVDEDHIAALRRALVAPLQLRSSVARVLVSPAAELGALPFALLFEEHAVVTVPSGTLIPLLRAPGNQKSGGRVLAVGAPDYTRDRRRLPALPKTRAEAEAIGDVVLLGEDATEAGLRAALAKAPHWRALHFACHGLLDAKHPFRSSLALTRTDTTDGTLDGYDVLDPQQRMHADLVVLSACATAAGTVDRTEGVVGLAHAFLLAGSPRVICALWKVDDEATQTLLRKFYELWNVKEGPSAAAALKQAQAFVRNQPKWSHPQYWAAWILVGLPD